MDLISTAYAAGSQAPQGNPLFSTLFFLVLLLGVMYLMMRPQMKRSKEHKQLMLKLTKGDEVVTNGGILGKIIKINNDFVELNIADNVNIMVQKPAISTTLPKGTIKQI